MLDILCMYFMLLVSVIIHATDKLFHVMISSHLKDNTGCGKMSCLLDLSNASCAQY